MIVVDTSVAVKWVVPERDEHRKADADAAIALLPQGLLAPDYIMARLGSAIFKKVKAREIAVKQAREPCAILADIVDFVPGVALVPHVGGSADFAPSEL